MGFKCVNESILLSNHSMYSVQDKEVSVHGDNVDVVDLEAVTPSTLAGKRPIEIVASTDSFECSSSKPGTLKIPKMEKLE